MTDKRSESERVSARLPSIAPLTDEIDSEWIADDIPAPPPVAQVALRPSSPPPAPPTTPLARPSSAPQSSSTQASLSSAPAIDNPLRRQTLWGIAPVITQRPETPVAAGPGHNSLRHQTLLGIAPVLPEERRTLAVPPAGPATSLSSTPARAITASDAPTTSDVAFAPPASAKPQHAERQRAAGAPPAVSHSQSYDDLPALKPQRPRWLVPTGVAAALLLGVVGLRQLDRPPAPLSAGLARPIKVGQQAPHAGHALTESHAQDKDEDDRHADGGPRADPTRAEPQPLQAESDSADQARTNAPPATAKPAFSAPAGVGAGAISIQLSSKPPGARLFWKGKAIGTTPFVLQFQPGERHAYELGLPGYTTRKVVVDGAQTEINIGLQPEPFAGPY